MRNTSLVTISLPPAMVRESDKKAKLRQMTRSELIRAAIREYLGRHDAKRIAWEEKDTLQAIKIFEREKKQGKLKVLPVGGLAKLIGK
jgi:metal-responsive CopG/Arc/MetJ family transcriptional regulator